MLSLLKKLCGTLSAFCWLFGTMSYFFFVIYLPSKILVSNQYPLAYYSPLFAGDQWEIFGVFLLLFILITLLILMGVYLPKLTIFIAKKIDRSFKAAEDHSGLLVFGQLLFAMVTSFLFSLFVIH